MKNYIIVGCGFCGSVIARKLAEERNANVLIIERRNHIAGNMYDQLHNNIRIQHYGPHIFHTKEKSIYNFITKYGEWEDFSLRCMVNINGALLPSPFNFKAIDMLYPENEADFLKKALLHEYPRQNMVTIVTLLKSEVPQIRKFAELLFELDYRPYTAKQWGISPEEIDVSVLQRVPIILSYENSYFDDPYQCMPKYGFTYFFKDLLNHPNIKILINTDANKLIHLHENSVSVDGFDTDVTVVYTGAIDEFLNYRFGHLPYRSLIFKYQDKDVDSFQPVPVVSDPKAVGYTRITEYKKLPVQICDEKTVIAVEYPVAYHSEHTAELEPYYPIITNDNQKLYEKYAKALKSVKNLYLCGRLANYKYYNMDQAIIRAFEVFDEISKRNVG